MRMYETEFRRRFSRSRLPIAAWVTVGTTALALLAAAYAQSPSQPGPAAAAGNTSSGETLRPIGGPPLALAREAADAAIAKCQADGVAVSVVILDESGVPKLVETADHAIGALSAGAQKKAFTALTYKSDGLALFARISADRDLAAKIAAEPDKFFSRPGGARLIKSTDKILGVIGIAGSPSLAPTGPTGGERDDVCAAAGLAAIQVRLNTLGP